MTPRQVYISCLRAVQHKRPVLIIGGPGIGKTSLAKKLAKQLSMQLFITTPAINDPTDYKGLGMASKDGSHATFLPFGQMYELLNATVPTLWFIDDLGQATNSVQATLMPWILERCSGEHRLPDCVTIIAASNGREHKANVNGILEPVKSRFHKIIKMEPCYSEWRQDFAIPNKMPVDIISFLDFQGRKQNSLFNNFVPTSDMTNSPIPRTWANAGDLINDYLESESDESEYDDSTSVLFNDVVGSIGLTAASELWSFRATHKSLVGTIDDIIDDPRNAFIPTDINAQFAVINSLARRANDENLDSIFQYAVRLNENIQPELPVSMLNDIFLLKPDLTQHYAFTKIMTSKEFGQAFMGKM